MFETMLECKERRPIMEVKVSKDLTMAVAGKNSDLETTDVAAPSRGLCRAECNTVKRRGALKNVQASRGVATSNVTLLSNRYYGDKGALTLCAEDSKLLGDQIGR